MSRAVVGISAHFHDSACCILEDGRLVAAAQEERFTRVKDTNALPIQAFRFCLRQAGVSVAGVDCVAYYETPVKKLERQLWMGLPEVPIADERALFRFDATRAEREIRDYLGFEGPLEYFDHHLSHAASSYYFSGFQDAAILTVDAVGEWATTTYGHGRGDEIQLFEDVEFPHSLGLFYSAITAYLGFRVNSGEYKVMGLAPYGSPKYVDALRQVVQAGEHGQFRLALEFFDFLRGARMFSPALCDLLGHPPREPGSELGQFEQDVARSAQVVLEDLLLDKVRYLHTKVPSRNLALAGGVALNCVANGKILREGPFESLFVQPAAGDAGGCLGAAVLADRRLSGRVTQPRLEHACWGPAFSCEQIARLFEGTATPCHHFHGTFDDLARETARRLSAGQVIGWFQGRMEFGPRALGSRSILADPRDPGMRDRINELVKKRESFRPFAPALVAEQARDYMDLHQPSPFMLLTCQVTASVPLPAITHVDGSARPQTVSADVLPRFHALLRAFEAVTGCPVLLNTSFNERDEPIVCTPVDAIRCFLRCGLDALILEDILLDRRDVSPSWHDAVSRMPPVRSEPAANVYTLL